MNTKKTGKHGIAVEKAEVYKLIKIPNTNQKTKLLCFELKKRKCVRINVCRATIWEHCQIYKIWQLPNKKHIINKKCKQIGNNIREVRNIFPIYFTIKLVENVLYESLKIVTIYLAFQVYDKLQLLKHNISTTNPKEEKDIANAFRHSAKTLRLSMNVTKSFLDTEKDGSINNKSEEPEPNNKPSVVTSSSLRQEIVHKIRRSEEYSFDRCQKTTSKQ